MEVVSRHYRDYETRILESLKSNGICHRTKDSSGLWVGPLMGLGAAVTILREDGSYSEICLLTGIAGLGLIISCACLFNRLSTKKIAVKDFQVVYFLPAMITSMLFVLLANKGLLASVAWGLSIGTLSTWGVLQVMSHFPGCFTIGEAMAVTHGSVLFLLSATTNLPLRYHLPPIHNDDIATVILQVGILFVMLFCLLCKSFPKLRMPWYFYSMVSGVLLLVVVPLLHIMLDQSPLLWLLYFLFSKPNRIFLILYWVFCLASGVGIVTYQILSNSQATSSARKTFHILAVLVYIPGLMYETTLLYLASGTMMGLFTTLELMRILNLPPLGEILQRGFSVFADEKDTLISLTPLYLLCGLSFPLWMPMSNLDLLPLLSGVLAVGVGDTAASICGSKYGKHKWSGSKKSIEGTAACILSQLVIIYGLAYLGYIDGSLTLIKSTLSVIGVSLVEAWTDQVDNLVLPLLMYLTLRL